jgi:hypothetical protein
MYPSCDFGERTKAARLHCRAAFFCPNQGDDGPQPWLKFDHAMVE